MIKLNETYRRQSSRNTIIDPGRPVRQRAQRVGGGRDQFPENCQSARAEAGQASKKGHGVHAEVSSRKEKRVSSDVSAACAAYRLFFAQAADKQHGRDEVGKMIASGELKTSS